MGGESPLGYAHADHGALGRGMCSQTYSGFGNGSLPVPLLLVPDSPSGLPVTTVLWLLRVAIVAGLIL